MRFLAHKMGGVQHVAPVTPLPKRTLADRFVGRVRRAIGDEYGKVEATTRKKKGRVDVGLVPFSMAAHQYQEPAFDVSVVPGANLQNLGPFDVPARGYIRNIYLLVTMSGGVAGTATEDAPFNIFDEVALLDVNGAPIYGSGMRGYDTFLANLFGGYAFWQDPRQAPDSVLTTPNFAFGVRIPIEIHAATGLGALANQNSASSYKVRLGLNAVSQVWSVAPTTIPTVRIRGYVEGWTQPADTDLSGRPQAQAPPFHETAQYWSRTNKPITAGENNIKVDRMGNLIRTIVLVLRTAAGARSTTNFPDPFVVEWDNRQINNISRFHLRALAAEEIQPLSGLASNFPAGVFYLGLDKDNLGHQGGGTPELWIPTVQATRFELRGNFGAAGSLDVLVNDIAPAEVNPRERYDETSQTGFTPNRDDA